MRHAWRDEILDELNDGFASGDLTLATDFTCYLLTREGLKDIIRGSYAEAKRAVDNGQ